MIVFGIYQNLFIVLPIRLKTCRSNGFLLKGKIGASEKSASQEFCTPGHGRSALGAQVEYLKKKRKFGQLIEYNMTDIFFEKSYTKSGRETIPRLFLKTSKLSISLDQ